MFYRENDHDIIGEDLGLMRAARQVPYGQEIICIDSFTDEASTPDRTLTSRSDEETDDAVMER